MNEEKQDIPNTDELFAKVTVPDIPKMPEILGKPERQWIEKARRFYRFGPSTEGMSAIDDSVEPAPDFEFPAGFLPLRDLRPGLPAVICKGAEGEPATVLNLEDAVLRIILSVQESGRPAKMLMELLPRIVRRISRNVRKAQTPVPMREPAGEEIPKLVDELEILGDSAKTLSEDINYFLSSIPISWNLMGPSVSTEILASEMLKESRESAHYRIATEAQAIVEHIDDLLQIDDAKGSHEGFDRSVREGMGEIGEQLFDIDMISKLHPNRNAVRLASDRRKRIEDAHKIIKKWLDEDVSGSRRIYILKAKDSISELEKNPPEGVFFSHHERAIPAAVNLFSELAEKIVSVARAMRIAKLEISGSYIPKTHNDAIATIDWQALRPDELALVPPVVVDVDFGGLRSRDLGDLCRLVWSGRPVVVMAHGPAPDPSEMQDLTRHQPAIGNLIPALNHAWVLQSATIRPKHLAENILKADPCRPSVVLIARTDATTMGEASLSGRAWPLFLFRHNDDGSNCIELQDNPMHSQDWPVYSIEVMTQTGIETMQIPVTFAEAAALLPVGREHFLPIPTEGWDEEQLHLIDWIEHPERDQPDGPVAFIWVAGKDEILYRAIVSRALALACIDRLKAYRLLQEMAGVGGIHLARARKEAKAEAEIEAQKKIDLLIEEKNAAVQEAAREGARNAMSNLASSLLAAEPLTAFSANLAGAGIAGRITKESESEDAGLAETDETDIQEEPEEEEEVLIDEPWIDTPLCTSCNDCFKINELLFSYDDNKQAVFKDLSKGTYAELVRAAEICPAKCIHPGKPDPNDKTATPEFVERGKKL